MATHMSWPNMIRVKKGCHLQKKKDFNIENTKPEEYCLKMQQQWVVVCACGRGPAGGSMRTDTFIQSQNKMFDCPTPLRKVLSFAAKINFLTGFENQIMNKKLKCRGFCSKKCHIKPTCVKFCYENINVDFINSLMQSFQNWNLNNSHIIIHI